MAGGKYTTFRKISQELADFAFPKSRSSGHESKAPLSDPSEYAARQSGDPIWGRFTDHWIKWKIQHHAPCSLEDIVFRRMPLWMAGNRINSALIDRIATIAQPHFGWSDSEMILQKNKVQERLDLGQKWLKTEA